MIGSLLRKMMNVARMVNQYAHSSGPGYGPKVIVILGKRVFQYYLLLIQKAHSTGLFKSPVCGTVVVPVLWMTETLSPSYTNAFYLGGST